MKPVIGLVTVLTDQLALMKDFYSRVLGFEVLEDLGNYVEFTNRGTRFALCTRQVMHEHTDHPSYTEKPAGQSFELAFPASEEENARARTKCASAGSREPIRQNYNILSNQIKRTTNMALLKVVHIFRPFI